MRQTDKLSCAPVNKNGYTFSVINRDTQLFDMSTNEGREISIKIKQHICKIKNSDCSCIQSTEKIKSVSSQKSSSSFNSILYSYNMLF